MAEECTCGEDEIRSDCPVHNTHYAESRLCVCNAPSVAMDCPVHGQKALHTHRYDPKFHITAGELRELGVSMPKNIPDEAWVPRYSMRIDDTVVEEGDRTDVFNITMTMHFTEPFRWFQMTVTVEDEDG